MSSAPLISVITPTRDRRRLLCETIESVQRQTLQRWEHLVIDDGSTDGTAQEVIARSKADPRLRYIQRETATSGANACRNIGTARSKADLLVFLDSDDLLRPDCLEHRLAIMQRNQDLDFAVFRAGVFQDRAGDLCRLYHPLDPGDDLLRFLSHECAWQTSGPIWRRAFLDKIGGFDEALPSMQDLELHVRALCARGRYVAFQGVDHDIRGQDDPARTSTRHFRDPAYIEAAEKVREKLRASVTNAGLLTWSRRRALAGLCFGAAQSWAKAGSLSQALRAWNQGCRQQGGHPALQIAGTVMLWVQSLDKSGHGLFSRLVNKWKGWVRFRQEPALLGVPTAPEAH